MAWTKHGWYVDGTTLDYDTRPGDVVVCGGPEKCEDCGDEARVLLNIEAAKRSAEQEVSE